MTYAVDGSLNVSVVDGSVYTGLYAADGSYNVFVVDGTTYVGAYAPCGAWNVRTAPVPAVGAQTISSPEGGLYVSQTPYTNGAQRVTVITGVIP
jgi:hypothetical protein